jgi:hypothetical protein
LVTGVLFTAVVAEGAYIIKTQRQVDTLVNQVQQLTVEAEEGPVRELPRSSGSSWMGDRPTAAAGGAPARLPPPRFNLPPPESPALAGSVPSTPGTNKAPLPPALDTPEARDQLRNFIATELQVQRDNMREQQRQQREEEQQRRMEATVKALGISPEQGAKLSQVMAQADDSRRQLRDKVQSGQVSRNDLGKEFAALREQTDKQIRDAIGDEKAQKFQELRRQQGPGGGGFGGPGGPGWGPGFRGAGGPPPGGGQPGAQP